MREVLIDQTESTNTLARAMVGTLDHMAVVRAICQSAGRGQRGNSWEAEPGKNLTLSIVLKPEGFPALRQFEMSECVALGVVDALSEYGIKAKIKWPNDIYVGDRKICGILLEHSVMGTDLQYSIAGIGLNVNQLKFISDAPNPVSMTQLTGKEYDLDKVCAILTDAISDRITLLTGGDAIAAACRHAEFKNCLWRGDGKLYPFDDLRYGSPRRFAGRIADVLPTGLLRVGSADGVTVDFGFKEIRFVLDSAGDGR